MKKGIVIILIAAFVASMLTACGKSAKATASPAESTTDEPTVVVTHPVVADEELTIPIGKDEEDYDPEAGEPALEDPNSLPAPPAEEGTTGNIAEDPTSSDYTYQPEDYGESYSDWSNGPITIYNPETKRIYSKDEFNLPKQDYFWINDETFDAIGYFFACGASYVTLNKTNVIAYFEQPASNQYIVNISFSSGESRNGAKVFYGTDIVSGSTSTQRNNAWDYETGKAVYLYDLSKYPAGECPVDTYYVSILPAYVNAVLNAANSATCLLDNCGIPHSCTKPEGSSITCAESN